jgi:hypothetical protein
MVFWAWLICSTIASVQPPLGEKKTLVSAEAIKGNKNKNKARANFLIGKIIPDF